MVKKFKEGDKRWYFDTYLWREVEVKVLMVGEDDYICDGEDEIRKRYREMSLACHPDKGGKQEEFVLLTEHKNKCISWAKKNKF